MDIDSIKNTIIQWDCLEVMKTLPDKCIDLVIADPPYNVWYEYESHDDNMIDYQKWCFEWFDECMRIWKCVAVTPWMKNISMWWLKTPLWYIAWVKSNQCSPSSIWWFNIREPILIWWKTNKRVWQDSFSIPNWLQSDTGNHPCPKNKLARRYIIEMLTNKWQTVLDPFGGSGTTWVVCKELWYSYILIEKEPKYIEIINKRLENITPSLF